MIFAAMMSGAGDWQSVRAIVFEPEDVEVDLVAVNEFFIVAIAH